MKILPQSNHPSALTQIDNHQSIANNRRANKLESLTSIKRALLKLATETSSTNLLQWEFVKPKYWPLWLGIALMRGICLLPLRARWRFGSVLGTAGYLFAKRRRHIVEVNLKLCFPGLNQLEIIDLTKENFKSSGISLIETALVWFTDPKQYRDITDIQGLDHLQAANIQGRGVLLVGMHLSTLDFAGAVLSSHQSFDVMYRRNKNKLLEAVMTRGRIRNFPSAIERTDIRRVIRQLKQGHIVWYGPDQDYGRKHSVFVPFFDNHAATITATGRIVKMTDAAVVIFSHYRDLETGRYQIVLSEALDNFPTEDDIADCTRLNQIIESAILEHPEQYWWLHRRFKSQPEGRQRPYDDVAS